MSFPVVNLLKASFFILTLPIVLVGFLMNHFEPFLPVFLKQAFRYGKFSYKGKPSLLKPLEVPKRWFRHFYVFAIVFSTFALFLTVTVYFTSKAPPAWVLVSLDILGSPNRRISVNRASVLAALCLMCLQSWRRFYETFFVSIFSHSRINLSHYVIGFFHYFGAVTAILVEAPGFTKQFSSDYKSARISYNDLSWCCICGCVLFLWAWWHQYKAAVIHANLRRNEAGAIISYKHSVPHGDLFEYVSSPHLLCEVVMYLALSLVLMGNSTWLFVFIWVLTNQMETAMLSHWWYKEQFDDYPKQRCAFIPFVL